MRMRDLAYMSFLGNCLLGCSTAEYDEAYARSLKAFREASEFALFQGENTFITPELGIRLPVGFVKASTDQAADLSRSIPGFLGAFTRSVSIGGRQTQVPLVVAQPTNLNTVQLEEAIAAAVRQTPDFGSQTTIWETREVTPVAGGPKVWRVLSLRGSIPFQVEHDQERKSLKSDGLWEFWISADRNQKTCILFSWQLPRATSETLDVPLEELPSTLARTLTQRLERPDAEPEPTSVSPNAEQ